MDQTKTVIENRVDQLGLSNPNVAVEGKNRIRVELPGATDANEAIEQIGKTAQLKFTMADQGFVLDGSAVKDANSGTSHEGKGYVVNLEFNRNGAKAFENATKKALRAQLGPLPGRPQIPFFESRRFPRQPTHPPVEMLRMVARLPYSDRKSVV